MRRWRHCALGIAMAAGAIHESPPDARATIIWPSDIAGVERDLQATEVAVRRAAANRLAELPLATVERLLPMVLADADPEVRLLAAAGARLVPATWSPPRIARISDWLRDGDWRLRHAAAELLTRAPDATAIADLVRSLGDSEAAVRGQVVQALLATGHRDAVLPLLGRIDDPDPTVREQILLALSVLGDERAVLPLLGKLQDQRPSVRIGAARALGRLKDARAVAALLLAFGDSDLEVKGAVAGALAELQATQAAEPLIALFRTTHDEALQRAVLLALAQLKSSTAAAAVVQALGSDDAQISELALQALPRASDLLVEGLKQCLAGQPSEREGNACAIALGRVGEARLGSGAGTLLLGALQRGVVTPSVALDVLLQLRVAAALPTALALLEDDDAQLRLQAARLAGHLLDPAHPDGTAIEPLLKALNQPHSSPRLQQSLLMALGRTASPRASAALQPYLNALHRPALRLAAIEACGWVAGEGTTDALLPLLDDADAQVRLAAALALRRIADAASFQSLWQRLTVMPAQDREAVAVALAGSWRRAPAALQLAALNRQISGSRGTLRDALLESVSFMPTERGTALFVGLLEHSDLPTRAKIAEVSAGYGAPASAVLQRVLSESGQQDAQVRANAAWALGSAGQAGVQPLIPLTQDPDHAVAANAVASLARVHPDAAALAATLCAFIDDPRAYVRANALTGLRLRAQRCAQGTERRLLANDRSASVRLAAARLMATLPSNDAKQDAIALARCREQEIAPEVAQVCSAGRSDHFESTETAEATNVFVLPRGGGQPLAQAPFALLTEHGFIRSGWTDRRGAIFERTTVPLRLVVAPQLVTVE
jgi:HEAT repeat protein